MAFTNHFYHSLTRKYIAVFGSVFNKITIKRYDKDGNELQTVPVPISFGPWQKFLLRNTSDPNLSRKYQAILPRMTFDLEGISYDSDRKINQLNKININDENSNKNFIYNPVPYNLYFTLYVTAVNMEDGAQILEQILPFFQPSFVPSVYLLNGLDSSVDVPIDLQNISYEDVYDDNFENQRFVRWTLTFIMRGQYFGPTKKGSVIKFIDVQNKIVNPDGTSYNGSLLTIQPGMDETGNATTNIDDTVEYININNTDDWDFIKQLHVFEELKEKGLLDDEDLNPHETNGKI